MAEAPAKPPLLDRLLTRLAKAVCANPSRFILPQVFIAIACAAFTVWKLEFHTSRNDLVGADKEYHNNFLQFQKEFPLQDDLVAVVESSDQERNRQFVARLGQRLAGETNLFRAVFYRRDLRTLGTNTLLITPIEDLAVLTNKLGEFRPFIATFSAAPNFASFVRQVNDQFLTAGETENPDTEKLVASLPALQKIIQQATHAIEMPGTPPPPGMGAFVGDPEAEQDMHISFANGRLFLVVAHPLSRDHKSEAVQRLRELVEDTKAEVPGVNVGVTGEPVLEYDEMSQSQSDTMRAALLALFLVAVIFIFGYHETGRPLKATGCLLVGLAYTMAYATLAVGHLNILTITFAPILIGLAIDFGVHLVTRYEEELRAGADEAEAMRIALVLTGRGIFTGCLTTSAAFLAMAFTEFRGISEMGLIVGGGLVIALVPMMTMLPALLLRGRQNVLDHELADQWNPRAAIEGAWLRRPVLVVVATALLGGLGWWQAERRFAFDYDLRNLQSKGLPAVKWEKELIARATNSVLYSAVVANNATHAKQLTDILNERAPSISAVVSMAPFIGRQDPAKREMIQVVKDNLGDIGINDRDIAPVDTDELRLQLSTLKGYVHLAERAAEKGGATEMAATLHSLWDDCARILNLIDADPAKARRQLTLFQSAMRRDVLETLHVLQTQNAEHEIHVADLPMSLQDRFVAPETGRLLLRVHSKGDIWKRDVQEEFVTDVRKALEDTGVTVTGTPVQLFEYTKLLVDSYIIAAAYATAAIVVMVLLHFRSLVCVLMALLPVAMGMIWMTAVMGVVGMPFNPANVMTLPLVIGVGVTSGVHILNRFSEEQSPAILGRSTGKAILVSALTTVAGFGSLMVAQHQGIESLGFVMAVGTATCMAAALVFLPALLTLLVRTGWRLR